MPGFAVGTSSYHETRAPRPAFLQVPCSTVQARTHT